MGVIPGVERHALGLHNALGSAAITSGRIYFFERCKMQKLKEMMTELMAEYTTLDVLNMLILVSGMKESKMQVKYADERDDEIATERQRLEEWEKGGAYTADDFPDFIKERLAENGISPNQMAVDAFNSLKASNAVKQNCIIHLGIAHFNVEGYSFLISYSIGKFITREEAKEWVIASGAFNGE